MQSLFLIGETDYTERVNKQSYSVNAVDMIQVWVDANHVTHGDLLRTKVQGSFTITFISANEYNAFVDNVANNKRADGKVPVTMYINNTNTTKSFNAFLDTSQVKTAFSTKHFGGNAVVFGVSINVEEE